MAHLYRWQAGEARKEDRKATGNDIAFDYNTNKSTVYYAITWAEETLVKNDKFHLPSMKKLLEDKTIENVVVDATEIEIERPQKNKRSTIRARKKGTR